MGLGLALVKGLVESHDGRVAARSPVAHGIGAELTLTLPLIVTTALSATNNGTAAKVDGQRILLIEDNVDIARTMSALLKLTGHTVVVAYSGAEGLGKFAELMPHTVLCDIGLPGGMDGLAVARLLRQRHPEIKLNVALSGYGSDTDLLQSLNAGFDFHLTKPVDIKTLNLILHQEALV